LFVSYESSVKELLNQSLRTTPYYKQASPSGTNEPSAQPLSNPLLLHRTFREMGTILVQIIRNLELTGHCSTVPLPPSLPLWRVLKTWCPLSPTLFLSTR